MKKTEVNWYIRELEIEDIDDVYDLLRPFYDESHYGDKGTFSPEHSITYIATFLSVEYCTTFGIFVEDKLSGLITLDINHEFHTKPMGYITNFYVSPKTRGTGAARKLIESARDLWQSHDCLNVYAANTGMHTRKANNLFDNLFGKYGFEKFSNLLILKGG